MNDLLSLRTQMRDTHIAKQTEVISALVDKHSLTKAERAKIGTKAEELIGKIRGASNPGLMEVFLAEYGLSTSEGVALMCLAEALLRVPDAETIDDLIEDKIAPSAWGEHLGKSNSSLVNASTWALMLSGKVLKDTNSGGLADTLHGAIKRLGEPVIRTAVKRAMKEMGHQFVLGETISEALTRGKAQEEKGYTYSYDMLGEAALTDKDANEFFESYADAIKELAAHSTSSDPRENPGISIKLSALHPRYELGQKARVIAELVPRVKELAMAAKDANMGLNIDAEEADRLDISLDVIEAVVSDPCFAGWDGFGVVVQAYGKRAGLVIEWLNSLAKQLDRKFMVRLVKGAYWDTEIKLAQVEGLAGFPVFTSKAATDISYICCAKKLFAYSDRLYPQFATHNAHTVSAILNIADDSQAFEFQRLHGMGESLHNIVLEKENTRCRIYAPVGAHRDLLAYLVRRLLENGANSSFVNQITNEEVSAAEIATDPFDQLAEASALDNASVINPRDLFQPQRKNSVGWDLRNIDDLETFDQIREQFKAKQWIAGPMISGVDKAVTGKPVFNPADPQDQVGLVSLANEEQVEIAISNAAPWDTISAKERKVILNKVADLYEENAGEIFASLCREAGKTPLDCIAEIREAVDFLRYYAAEAVKHEHLAARGIITCISPWNFPLAIFTGQISAALAAGNAVLAKPADPTPITASIAVGLMHRAGVPDNVIQLLPGSGREVGQMLTTDARVDGVCFTGSTGVSKLINQNASKTLDPSSMFIAETGGINAMIVDSTALPEQAVQDIVDSAFRSAGQRCSALRVLYLQKDIETEFMAMLYGAMDELEISNPWDVSSDVGPIINEAARDRIDQHIKAAQKQGNLLKQMDVPSDGCFIGPAVIGVNGIEDLETEVFGPVLHVATFEAGEIDAIIQSVNDSGYGLTFGLHTRIDDRVQHVASNLNVGNFYVNRNQIGAVVGSQPFGGEGLSGTGPKAGGSHYMKRFKKQALPNHEMVEGLKADASQVQALLDAAKQPRLELLEVKDLPGPTGESNRWSTLGRGTVLCLGPSVEDAEQQMAIAKQMGCKAIAVVPGLKGPNTISGLLDRAALESLSQFDAVALWSQRDDLVTARLALSKREGAFVPLITTDAMHDLCVLERHLCIDTTASGGNVSLLAAQ